MINFQKNVTGTKMLMVIGMMHSFILSGKLRTRGNFPLQELLQQNAKEGGDLQNLIAAIAKAAGEAGSCGIDFDFSDQDIQELFEENALSIKELPEGFIEISISQKKTGEVSLGIKVGLSDGLDSPVIGLSMNLYGKQIPKVVHVLKNQFLAGRIPDLIKALAFSEFQKGRPVKSLFQQKLEAMARARGQETSGDQSDSFENKSSAELWSLAEKTLTTVFAKPDKIKNFSFVFGLFITDKLTLSADFKQKAVKKN